jgi:hypothetical protein
VYAIPNGEDTPENIIEKTYINQRVLLLEQTKADFIADNGMISVIFGAGRLKSIRSKQPRRTVKAGRGESLYSLRFVRTPQNTGWMQEEKTVAEFIFKPKQSKILAAGPVMWKYRTEGELAGALVTIDMTLKAGRKAIEFDLLLDNKPQTDGYFVMDFNCDDGAKLYSDVYFGVEPRDAANAKLIHGESSIEGQIYGRNFTMFESGGIPVSIVSENCSVYYIHDFKRNKMGIILTKVMLNEYSQENWFGDVPDVRIEGRHDFKFALAVSPKTGDFTDIQRFVKSYHHPLLTSYKNNKNTEGEPAAASFISSDNPGIVQSAVYFEDGWYTARFFETNGKSGKVKLRFAEKIYKPEFVDFNGEPMDINFTHTANKKSVMFDITKFKIVTLRFKINL